MFKRMLLVQWKWSRWSVLLLSLAAIAVTMWSVSAAGNRTAGSTSPLASRLDMANFWYHFLVWVAGFLLAMHAWRTDHAGKHVYALTLPIPRWRFGLYRYAAGLIFAAVIVLALWVGALVAASGAEVPPGLRTYPTGLAFRIGVALFAIYAVFFVLWSATPKVGYYAAAVLVLFFLLSAFQANDVARMVQTVLMAGWKGVGFSEIMAGRWFLIDV
jgi:hypothetical protein